jgi:hypothetical protein
VRSTINLKSSIEKTIRMWGTKQMEAALSRAQTELESTVLQLPDELRLDGDTWEQVLKALPAFAGVGFLGASIAAVPTVLSLATVGTSVFIFWAAAPIISPLFVIGVMGVFLTALLGSRSLKFAHDRARTKLILRLRREAERQVFGIGQKSGTRCMLSDIQAAVVRAGQNQIQGLP